MDTRTERIRSLLARRKPIAVKVQGAIEALGLLGGGLNNLVQAAADCAVPTAERISTRALDFAGRLAVEQSALRHLAQRFDRQTLNIGVSGMSRQGKSRLMRTLTGLGDELIPTGELGPCTRVRSTIQNCKGVVAAIVTMHTRATLFSEVLLPHFDKLLFLPRPTSLENFLAMRLPQAPDGATGREREMLDRLRLYQNHFSSLALLLDGPTELPVPVPEFRRYVADYDAAGRPLGHAWLAVRHARILCPLPNADAAQVALVDMPGLGDTGVGDEERLLAALAAEVDAVIFLKKPGHNGDKIRDDEQRLWQLANGAQEGVPARLWTFWLFNRETGKADNARQCEVCRDQIPHRHIEVAGVLEADCTDAASVRAVLDAVLDHLSNEMESLDAAFGRTRHDALAALLKEIGEWVKADIAAPSQGAGQGYFAMFKERFENLYKNLTGAFQNLYEARLEGRSAPHQSYLDALKRLIDVAEADSGIPDETGLLRLAAAAGGITAAYPKLMDAVRARLSQRFLGLDEPLRAAVDELRATVRHTLEEHGGFGALLPVPRDNSVWWSKEGVLRLIAEAAPKCGGLPNLTAGFELLAGFALTYRGFAQWRVRAELDELTPDLARENRLPAQPTAKQAVELLSTHYAEVCYRMRQRLAELETEPHAAIFAIFEEFRDRVFLAERGATEWELLYDNFSGDVWRQDFAEAEEKTRRHQRWRQHIDTVETALTAAQPQF